MGVMQDNKWGFATIGALVLAIAGALSEVNKARQQLAQEINVAVEKRINNLSVGEGLNPQETLLKAREALNTILELQDPNSCQKFSLYSKEPIIKGPSERLRQKVLATLQAAADLAQSNFSDAQNHKDWADLAVALRVVAGNLRRGELASPSRRLSPKWPKSPEVPLDKVRAALLLVNKVLEE